MDVLIIGGGGAGISTALHLARRGAEVTLLERGLVGTQATGVNFGGVRQQGRHPAELPLSARSRRLWARMAELVGTDAEFDPCGHLKLARSPAEEAELVKWNAMARAHGLDPQMVGRNAIRSDYPFFSDLVIAGSLLADDGTANPRLLGAAFAQAARAAGATVLENHRVEAVGHDGSDFTVTANGQVFRAPMLVNTAGFWGGRIAAQFGEPVPVAPLAPNLIVTEPVPHFLARSLGVVGGNFYGRQTARGNLVLGSGRGEADPQEALPTSRPLPATSMIAMRRAIEVIPHLAGVMMIRSWAGIDGEMPDDLPVMGFSHTRPGLVHGFGFSGHGFMLGPAVGEILSELVLDGRTDVPLSPFDIARFRDWQGEDGPRAETEH
jgi:sarcosine oxidase subunit beta